MRAAASGPLVITDDDFVLTALVRAAAAAGLVPEVVRDPAAAVAGWSGASTVLIGADQVAAIATWALPRRSGVYVVGHVAVGGDLFRDALACGADAVLELPEAERRVVDILTDSVDGVSAVGSVVGVVGGAGGVGASTFAVALAIRYAEQGIALLVDADPAGGGADQILGLDIDAGVRWDSLVQAAGRLSARSLREALPQRGDLSVLAWPVERDVELPLATVRSVLGAAQRGYGAVVVDVPRAPGPVAEEVLARCDRIVVVSTVTVPALAACLHVVRRLPAGRAVAVLRGRGGVSDAEVARLLGIPVAHRMPDQRGIDEAVSLGLGPLRSRRGPLARGVRGVVATLQIGTGQ